MHPRDSWESRSFVFKQCNSNSLPLGRFYFYCAALFLFMLTMGSLILAPLPFIRSRRPCKRMQGRVAHQLSSYMTMACDYSSKKTRRNGLGSTMTITLNGLLALLIRPNQMVLSV